ncbi:MAG: hypothetical protein JW807_11065 [Spirochaetes bacterium]|nr:hypothetical protein [Spirochaetota bacterium]
MKLVIFIGLCIAVQTSLAIHLFSLVGYISTKKLNHFRNFMITASTNFILSIIIAIIVAVDPKVLSGIKLDVVFILESGLLFIYMMAIKVRLTVIIIRRAKDPANYHMSYFGKKIYNTTIVDFKELMTYFLTFPFTMMAGAYFFVKIIHY